MRLVHGLVLAALALSGASAQVPSAPPPGCAAGATAMARLELVFGLSRKNAPDIDEEAWAGFLAEIVTPRFPDGLTVIEGRGQWRGASGEIRGEKVKILLIWHVPDATSEARIEAIRAAYKARFAQESVLRAEGMSCLWF